MPYIKVFGQYKHFYNDVPASAGQIVKVRLMTVDGDLNDFDAEAIYLAEEHSVVLLDNGYLPDTDNGDPADFLLWCNAGGSTGSIYEFTDPDGKKWRATIQFGDGTPKNITEIRAGGVVPADTDTVLGLIETNIANSAVRFDIAQSLSDAEKLQARTNIGAGTGDGGGASVSDTAYDAASWNGVTDTAPSKNAVRDKIELLATDIAGKADSAHTHDDRYYTEAETDSLLAGKASSSHNHDSSYYRQSEVDDLLSDKSDIDHNHNGDYAEIGHDHDGVYSPVGHNHDASYSPLGHNHDASYSPLGHNHTSSEVTDFSDAVQSTVLSNLATGSNASIADTDTLNEALAKLQAQIDNIDTGDGGGTPGGASGNIQYNDGSDFAGSDELFWDAANNRLGIGTTTPGATLPNLFANHADSRIIAVKSASSSGDAGVFIRRGDDARGIDIWSDSAPGSAYIDQLGNSDIRFRLNSLNASPTTVMTLGYAGGVNGVGIGLTTPRRRLDVLAQGSPQARFSYTDNSVYSEIETLSTGNTKITNTGGNFEVAGNVKVSSLLVGSDQVVGARQTGWTAGTGTASKGAFATGSATVTDVAERLLAIEQALRAHGLIN